MEAVEKLKHAIKNFVDARMGKNGVLGMDTATKFIIGLLALVILGVMVIVVFGVLLSTDAISGITGSATFTNQTTTAMNATGWQVTGTSALRNCNITTITAVNASANEAISSGNWTTSNCLVNASAADGWQNIAWNISGTYTFDEDTRITSILRNGSQGITTLFGNAVTWFVLLGIVIIILIIGVVIITVKAFDQTKGGL